MKRERKGNGEMAGKQQEHGVYPYASECSYQKKQKIVHSCRRFRQEPYSLHNCRSGAAAH